jgi:hypothetical protein
MEEAQTNGCIEQDVAWLVGKWEVTSAGEGKAQVVGNLDQKGQCFFKAAACVCPEAPRRRISGACIAALMLAFLCANPISSEVNMHEQREMPAVAASDQSSPAADGAAG